MNDSDFVYLDPPYLLGTGNYNDGNRGFKNWSIKEEKQLYKLIKKLDNLDIKFGLNNLLIHKNNTNEFLNDFLHNNPHLLVIDMGNNYKNSCYNKKTKNNASSELYITNYKSKMIKNE